MALPETWTSCEVPPCLKRRSVRGTRPSHCGGRSHKPADVAIRRPNRKGACPQGAPDTAPARRGELPSKKLTAGSFSPRALMATSNLRASAMNVSGSMGTRNPWPGVWTGTRDPRCAGGCGTADLRSAFDHFCVAVSSHGKPIWDVDRSPSSPGHPRKL